nr:peptidyl-prolyl cis-trans isomerase, FKBP-type [uncultured archaeon]CBH36607.1 probable peptidyl-prolyl cis-trans isomerase, FKBP-type [uncultured archaeon]
MRTEKKMRSQPTKLIGLLIIMVILLLASGCVEDGDVQTESESVELEEHQEELVAVQNEIAQAKVGDTIRVHYTGTLDNGTVFDSSVGREPLQFTIGRGQMIPGFDKGVVGLNLSESKTITIPADQAYGPYRADLVQVVARDQFPTDSELEVGQMLQASQPNGQIILVTVTNVTDSDVTLDANHRLAGKPLTFEIQLVEIVSSA